MATTRRLARPLKKGERIVPLSVGSEGFAVRQTLDDATAAKLLTMPVPDGYEQLAEVLTSALEQSSGGKGRERHANDKPFMEQPIITLGRMTGAGGPAFQAMKKIREALGMMERGQHEAAKAELLGAIVYTSATYLLANEKKAAS